MAAPLMMGNDLRNLAPEMKAILTAREVIAVDQAGHPPIHLPTRTPTRTRQHAPTAPRVTPLLLLHHCRLPPPCALSQLLSRQDALGEQGRRVWSGGADYCSRHEVWARPLVGGEFGVVVWARGVCGTHLQLGFNWTQLAAVAPGLPPHGPLAVRASVVRRTSPLALGCSRLSRPRSRSRSHQPTTTPDPLL